MSRLFGALVVSVIATSCAEVGPTGPTNVPVEAIAVPFNVIGDSYFWSSGFYEPSRMVIRTPEEMSLFWTILESSKMPKTMPPSIDFRRGVVVAAAMGGVPSNLESITIDSVFVLDATLFVLVNEHYPTGSCVFGSGGAPIVAVSVMVRPTRVVFIERESMDTCG